MTWIGDVAEMSAWPWDESEWAGDESINYDEFLRGNCYERSVEEDLSVYPHALFICKTNTNNKIAPQILLGHICLAAHD